MQEHLKLRIGRKVLFTTGLAMLFEIVFPTASFALTSGPAQPEFSSFEPVATTNMVNEFTGDFTYSLPVLNVPGANGGGYALSLSYHSGASPEEESSWVGYGWTLNPGAINRGKRGFPDDSKGDNITYRNFVPTNWTASVGARTNLEAFSIDAGVGLNASLRYNNYRGFSYTAGAGISYRKGLVSLGYSVTDGEGSFSANVNPGALLRSWKRNQNKLKQSEAYKSASCEEEAKMMNEAKTKDEKAQKILNKVNRAASFLSKIASAYGMYSISDVTKPTNITPYTGKSENYTIGIDAEPSGLPIGLGGNLSGNYTEQTSLDGRKHSSYGYMYSGEVSGTSDMMDYYTEKDSPYNKRDKYLSIPFSNADIYSLTGEGLGGGFRLHSKTPGHFYPNSANSTIPITQIGGEIHLGANVGGGGDVNAGQQTLSVGRSWDGYDGNTGAFQFPAYSGQDEYFFRFNNDLGGDVQYGSNNDASVASLVYVAGGWGNKSYAPAIDAKVSSQLTSGIDGVNRSGRSSYVGYHTNAEMSLLSSNSKKYKAYERNSSTNDFVKRDGSNNPIKDGIGEIVVFNEEGNRYIYGLPVYSRNEKDLQYGLDNTPANKIENNYIAYPRAGNITNPPTKLVGEERPAPYATAYLLTEITTPDYVDREMNGVDDTDFGGYTKFTYKQAYGTSGDAYKTQSETNRHWYKWRIPYNGLKYLTGEISNNEDDMGMVTHGEKEVYYMQTIETKTHIAVFVTNKTSFDLGNKTIEGSTSTRLDARDAHASEATAASSKTAKGSNDLETLERIELYSKPTSGSGTYKLVRTTHFEYDYSICKGLPNSIATQTPESGKLTLKKVWFEYEGTVDAKISPYEFEYEYPVTANANYPAVYDSLENYGDSRIQNPDYSPFDLDRWGNYQYNGLARHNMMNSWVDQTPDVDNFDPAAWQLKVIKFPTGGEIHIQYEQDDYLNVQDRSAMAMVRLKQGPGNPESRFYLDVEHDLGLSTSAEKQALVDRIKTEFANNKIYFKFLYALVGSTAILGDCNTEYVDGYVNVDVNNVDMDAQGNVYITVGSGSNAHKLPVDVCKDFVKTEKGGNIKTGANCNASEAGVMSNNPPKASDILLKLVAKIGTTLQPSSSCLKREDTLSYLRIPVAKAKLGGGIRVKRLLRYDKGIESGDAALYGNEYFYKTKEGISSGVATNEPSSGREENSLIEYLPKRNDQNFWQKITSGKDKEQFEGPIGESILPSPSVGYSRVVVKNIHSGKTNTGITISEFYTTKDYPFDKFYNTSTLNGRGVSYTEKTEKPDWQIILAGLVNKSVTNIWSSQGYRFIINEMNGQPKAVYTYAGDFGDMDDPKPTSLSSSQEFSYYEPGDLIPMMYSPNVITMGNPGKETEVVFEQRSVEDITEDGTLEFDGSLSLLLIPLPFGSAFPSVSYSESKMRTHVTTKIIHYPAIQKSVKSSQDGIYHLTEYAAFSPHTGKPLVTRTTDGFDNLNLEQSANHKGTYMAFNTSASLQYSSMGQKAVNERAVITSDANKLKIEKLISGGQAYLQLTDPSSSFLDTCFGGFSSTIKSLFPSGSLVKLSLKSSPSTDLGIYHVSDSIAGLKLYLYPTASYGTNSNTGEVIMEILRSGNTNQLNATAGEIKTYGYSTTSQLNDKRQILAHRMDSVLQLVASSQTGTILPYTSIPDSISLRWACNDECDNYLDSIYSMGIFFLPDFTNSEIYIFIPPFVSDTTLGCTDCVQRTDYNGDGTWNTLDVLYYFAQNINNLSPTLFARFPISSTSDLGRIGICALTGDPYWYPTSNPSSNCGSNLMIDLCDNTFLSNVISASAQTYNDNWPYDTTIYGAITGSTSYENGMKGKWRPQSNFVFRDTIKGGSKAGTSERNYNDAGIFTLTQFNWQDLSINDTVKWLKLNTVTKYNPDGNGTEEQDVLGIKSTAKFGYKGILPYMTAVNSDYASAQFESFENTYTGNKLEDGVGFFSPATIDNAVSHSGLSSLKLPYTGTSSQLTMKSFKMTSQLYNKGLEIKAWVKDSLHGSAPISATATSGAGMPVGITFTKVAQTGEWSLYRGKLLSAFSVGATVSISIKSTYASGNAIWIDDVRLQPYDAQMTTYVYDRNTLRVLASFDDQHFGLYYQYNAEGKLVRKQAETERGLKTITETQYHVPMKPRN